MKRLAAVQIIGGWITSTLEQVPDGCSKWNILYSIDSQGAHGAAALSHWRPYEADPVANVYEC